MNKGALVGISIGVVAATALTTGYYVLKPAAEQYIAPLVEQKLNDALNGTVSYDALTIDWNGKVVLRNITIKDKMQKKIIEAPEVSVSLSVMEAAKMVFTEGNPLAIISTIDVIKPRVFLWEDADKTWNINHLLKTTSDESELAFRGTVIVKDGQVQLSTADQKSITSTDINGAVKFNQYPEIIGVATAKINDDVIQANGSYTKGTNTNFSVAIKTDRLDLASVKQFIPSSMPVSLSSGVVSNTAVTIKKNSSDISVTGHAFVENVSGVVDGYNITKGAVNADFNGSAVNIESASAFVNDQFITAAGVTNINAAEYPITGSVSLHNVAVEKLLPTLGITGKINTTASITGTLGNPVVEGKGSFSNIAYDGIEIDKGRTDYSYNHNVVSLSGLDIVLGTGKLRGNGWYNLDTRSFEGYAEGNKVDVSRVSPFLGLDVSGTVDGSVTVSGKDAAMTSIAANLYGDNISYDGIEMSTVDGLVNGTNGVYNIPYLNATVGNGSITAYGTADATKADLRFNAYQLPLSIIGNYAGMEATGGMNFSGSFEGAYENPNVRFHFGSDRGSVHGIRFHSAYGEGELINHVLRLDKTIIGGNKGDYEIMGTVGLSGAQNVDVNASINDVRLESIAKGFTDMPVTGWLSTNVHVGGTLSSPEVTGKARLRDGSVYGELVSEATTSFNYGANRLDVSELLVHAYDSTITGSGSMIGSGLNFTLTGKNLVMERILRNKTMDINGYANVDGTITGTLDNPIFQGSLHSDEIAVNHVALNAIDGKIYVDPTVVNLQDLCFEQGKGHYQAHGGIRLGSEKLFGFAQVTGGEVGQIIKFTQLPIHNLDGSLTGRIDFGGTLKSPDVAISGVIKDTSIQGTITGDSEVEASLAQRKINITKLRIPMKNGFLAAQGTANLDGAANMQVVANDVPIELLMPLVGENNFNVKGNFAATVNITGQTQDPTMQISSSLDNLSYNGVLLDHVYALATMEKSMININQIMGERGAYKAIVSGKVPLAAFFKKSQIAPNENQNVDLTIDMSKADLGVVPLFVPNFVTNGVGALDGKVHVTGPLDGLKATGTVSVKNGTLTFADVQHPLSNITGTLAFNGQTATLATTAQMGKGTAELNGSADWQGGNLHSYKVALDMNSLEMVNHYFTGPLDGSLTYQWSGDIPSLAGKIDLHDARIDIPLSLGDSSTTSPIAIDIDVVAGKKVRLYNSLLYDLMISGNAHFGGSTLHPQPSGKFVVDTGSVKYLNTRFRILEGSAEFAIPNTFMPILKVKAETDLQNYRINFGLDGPVEEMKLTLSSSPHLTEQQIISLLTLKTTGANNNGLTAEGAGALMTAGLEMALFGSMETTLQDHLGIDTINISTNYLDPYKMRAQGETHPAMNYYSLEVGKYILPNLMFTAGLGLNYDLSKFGLQYYMGQNYNMNTWITSDHNYYVGGQWRYRF